jgi:integrase
LPFLPEKIRGKLFKTTTKDPEGDASKRLGKWLRSLGITDPAKVAAHSLRHRAQDRMRAVECPQDIRWALLGHEEKTIAEDYGEGHSMRVLKKWIDKIGF